jgi:hypothetical protein
MERVVTVRQAGVVVAPEEVTSQGREPINTTRTPPTWTAGREERGVTWDEERRR